MRKSYLGKLLSAALSVAMVFTSVVPSYAMEGLDGDFTDEEKDADELNEEDEASEPAAEDKAEGQSESPEEAPIEDSDTALYGDTITVSYDKNGGVGDDISPTPVTEGAKYVEAPSWTKTGYTFFAWNDSANKYKVYFDANKPAEAAAEVQGTMDDQSFTYDVAANLTANAYSLEGYTFTGWNTEPAPSEETPGTAYADKANVSNLTASDGATVILYAQWTEAAAVTHHLSFDSDHGSDVDDVDVNDGAYATAPTATKTGYTFEGWYEILGAQQLADEPFDFTNTAITRDYSFKALWTANTYPISYEYNGGAASTAEGAKYPATVEFDTAIGDITDPVYENHVFLEWNTEQSGTGRTVAATTELNNSTYEDLVKDNTVTLYAQWTTEAPAKYSVRVFYVIDGALQEGNEQIDDIDKGAVLKTVLDEAGKNKRDAFKFGGYFTDKDCAADHAIADDATVTANTSVYVKFTSAYTVFFDANGGTAVVDQVVDKGGFATKPTPDPVKDGYIFDNWYEVVDGVVSETPFAFETEAITKDRTLKALWIERSAPEGYFTVSFDTNGGSAVAAQYVKDGQKAQEPVNPTKANAAFDKWYSDKELKTDFDFTKPITADTVVYAGWINTYEVKFIYQPAGDTEEYPVLAPVTVNENSTVTKPAAPRLTGYKFGGWYADKELSTEFNFTNTNITKATKIYAKLTPITFKIHFDANGGTGTMPDQTITYGSGKLDKNVFSKAHYEFVVWTTKKMSPSTTDWDGVDAFSNETNTINKYCSTEGKTVTLYAYWQPVESDLTLDYGFDYFDEGHKPDRKTDVAKVYCGYPLSPYVPATVSRVGYYFDGWYTQADGGKKIDVTKEYDGTYDKLFAHWTEITYNVSFHSNLAKDTVVKKPYKISDAATTAIGFSDIFTDAKVQEEASKRTPSTVFWTSINSQYTAAEFTAQNIISREYAAVGGTSKTIKVDMYANWDPEYTYTVEFIYGTNDDNFAYTSKYFVSKLADNKYGHRESLAADENLYLTGTEFVNKQHKLTGWKYTVNGENEKSIGTKATLKNIGKAGDTVVFTAQWAQAESEYKLNLVTFGGTVTKTSPTQNLAKTYKNSETYVLPIMEKAGYEFKGWYNYDYSYYSNVNPEDAITKIGKDCDSRSSLGEFGDLTLYAVFIRNTYYVQFNKDGGTIGVSDSVLTRYFDYTYTWKNITYSKTGYKFSHWEYVDDNGNTQKLAANIVMKNLTAVNGKTVTVKAKWAPIKYTVTYSLGSGASQDRTAPKFYYPGETTDLATPTRKGYEFYDWTLAMKDKKAPMTVHLTWTSKGVAIDSSSYGNVVMTANWRPKQYGFRILDPNGDVWDIIPASEATDFTKSYDFTGVAKEISLSLNMREAGKSVKGFALNATDTKPKYALNKSHKIADIAKAADSNCAKTTIDLYVLTEDQKFFYDLENGVTHEVKTVNYDPKTGTTKFSAPSVAGYTFKEWEITGGAADTDYTVNGSAITIKKPATANGMHFTAKYESTKYTIVLMPNAADVYPEGMKNPVSTKGTDYKGGEEILYSSLNNLADQHWTREGYRFMGFAAKQSVKTLSELVTKEGGLKANNKGVVTLYGIWALNAYEIEYYTTGNVMDGGMFTGNVNVNYSKTKLVTSCAFGKTVTLPTKVDVYGYTFLGWSLASDPANADVQRNKAGYVTKVGPKNKAIVKLRPIFRENTYTLKISPNGGKMLDPWTGKMTTKPVTAGTKIKYTQNVVDNISAVLGGLTYDTITNPKRAGYKVNYIALSANGKTSIYPYTQYDDMGDISNIAWLSGKDKATVTIYVTWYKPSIGDKASVMPTLVQNNANPGTYDLYVYMDRYDSFNQVQYSTDPAFKKNVITKNITGYSGDPVATGLTGKGYYVRARQAVSYDSTGNLMYGAWSNVERAAKTVN